MMQRALGSSGVMVGAVGLGCWPIGGPYTNEKGLPCGYGQVDDEESIRAVQRAMELGVSLFDTAPIYGCGHSERVLGQAVRDVREKVVIATKFSAPIDEQRRIHLSGRRRPDEVPAACDESLRRLGTDYIDLYQLHAGQCEPEHAAEVFGQFERLREAGKIRWFGWSTDDPMRARMLSEYASGVSIQQRLNLFEGNRETTRVCEATGLASLNRTPLCKGLLTGKFSRSTVFAADDVRQPWWDLESGREASQLERFARIREVLTADGRSYAQAAIGWLWALSPVTIPIPGFKSVAQVEDNAGAMAAGPLTDQQMQQIAALLADQPD